MWEFVLILICDFSLYFIENLKKVFLGREILVILFIVFVALFLCGKLVVSFTFDFGIILAFISFFVNFAYEI